LRRFTPDNCEVTITALHEADHAAVFKGGAARASIERITKLLSLATSIPLSDRVKRRVTDRAIAGRAPYHRSKNSVADAIIIETYADVMAKKKKSSFAFVTHNIHDFSAGVGDSRKPHNDLGPLFDGHRSTYWTSAVELVKHIDEYLLMDHDLEFSGARQERRLSEILQAENLLTRQVWYNRHHNLRAQVHSGTIKVVPKASYSTKPYRQDQILDTIWQGALEAAKRTEEEIGVENLGPWDDFQWGMLNGKLSALRWVLGDDWDDLYT
jgi:hypothetical protein